jgi:hypothetical protein
MTDQEMAAQVIGVSNFERPDDRQPQISSSGAQPAILWRHHGFQPSTQFLELDSDRASIVYERICRGNDVRVGIDDQWNADLSRLHQA